MMTLNSRLTPILFVVIAVLLFCASLFAETDAAPPDHASWDTWTAIVAAFIGLILYPIVTKIVIPFGQAALKRYQNRNTGLPLLALAILPFAGCQSVPCSYVAADRATFEEVAPVYLAATEADATQSEAEKQIGRDVIDSWDHRIKAAEEDCNE